MKLTDLFSRDVFVITSEVGPVKGSCRQGGDPVPKFLQEAASIKSYVHAVNVTDNQSAIMRLGSLAGSYLLKQNGMNPVFQLTCRDRNRLALQSDLLSAYTLGVDNVLCITGDHINLGDHKSAKQVFDVDSVQLLRLARSLNEGQDMVGNSLSQSNNLALGAAVNPNFEPLELQMIKMEKKIIAGAEFFQTQPVYDPRRFEAFVKKAESFGVPVMFGMVVIKSPQMGRHINQNISGISVPDLLIQEMDSVSKERYKEKAVEITTSLLKDIAPMVQGIHFMPFGWSDIIPQVLSELCIPKVYSEPEPESTSTVS